MFGGSGRLRELLHPPVNDDANDNDDATTTTTLGIIVIVRLPSYCWCRRQQDPYGATVSLYLRVRCPEFSYLPVDLRPALQSRH